MKSGRSWVVEKHGRPRALALELELAHMFWTRCSIEPLVEFGPERDEVFTEVFWDDPNLVFRNSGNGRPLAYVLTNPKGHPTPEQPFIAVRGLYFPSGPLMQKLSAVVEAVLSHWPWTAKPWWR